MLTHLSLFSGIGGIDLAAEWAGFTTAGQCEIDDYASKILEKHWPNVPRWRDIRDVTAESFRERTGLHTVTLISGGFPCQPFSVAGKQEGKRDDRYLWPEMLRVIQELRPRWILGENVPGILRIAADDVCKSLEREGYDVGVFDFEAAAVGASHRRERIFFVANSRGGGFSEQNICGKQPGRTEVIGTSEAISNAHGDSCQSWWAEPERQQWQTWASNGGYDVADSNAERKSQQERTIGEIGRRAGYSGKDMAYPDCQERDRPVEYVNEARCAGFTDSNQWPIEPGLGGVVDGIPSGLHGAITFPEEPDIPRVAVGVENRVARLKCLGNAVVPQQVYPILQAIATIERSNP